MPNDTTATENAQRVLDGLPPKGMRYREESYVAPSGTTWFVSYRKGLWWVRLQIDSEPVLNQGLFASLNVQDEDVERVFSLRTRPFEPLPLAPVTRNDTWYHVYEHLSKAFNHGCVAGELKGDDRFDDEVDDIIRTVRLHRTLPSREQIATVMNMALCVEASADNPIYAGRILSLRCARGQSPMKSAWKRLTNCWLCWRNSDARPFRENPYAPRRAKEYGGRFGPSCVRDQA